MDLYSFESYVAITTRWWLMSSNEGQDNDNIRFLRGAVTVALMPLHIARTTALQFILLLSETLRRSVQSADIKFDRSPCSSPVCCQVQRWLYAVCSSCGAAPANARWRCGRFGGRLPWQLIPNSKWGCKCLVRFAAWDRPAMEILRSSGSAPICVGRSICLYVCACVSLFRSSSLRSIACVWAFACTLVCLRCLMIFHSDDRLSFAFGHTHTHT